MILETLRFEEELRRSDQFFAPISDQKSDDQLLNLAEELIERNSKPFDPSLFKDQYTAALRELIEKKADGKTGRLTTADEGEDRGTNVVNLMDALKKSLGDDQKKTGSGSKSSSGGSRKSSGTSSSAKSAQSGSSSGSKSSAAKSSASKSSASKSSGSKSTGGKGGASKGRGSKAA